MRSKRWIAALALVATLVPVSVAFARYTDSSTATASFTADVLNPPTGLGASAGLFLTATLTWTITPDTYATGYNVYRSTVSGSGYVLVKTVSPRTATSTTDTPLVPGTYYYVLRSVGGSWLSLTSNQASVLLL